MASTMTNNKVQEQSKKMSVKSVSSLLVCLMVGVVSQTGRAADAYSLTIETSFVISSSCTGADGKVQKSQINLVVSGDGSMDPKTLSTATAQIKVCSPFTSPINQKLPTPFPVALLKNAKSAPLGKITIFKLDPATFQAVFPAGQVPNQLNVNQIQSGVFELTYLISSTNTVKIGPIRAYLSQDNEITVPGFIEGKQLPIQKVEVDVPEKDVTLVANLAAVKTITVK